MEPTGQRPSAADPGNVRAYQVSGGVQPNQTAAQAAARSAAATTIPRVDDNWRRWLAENLMLGATAESILVAMTTAGIAPLEAAREIDLAQRSPYVRGATLLSNRLKKRDWILATYRKLNRLHPAAGEVPRRHKLPRQEFLEDYYSTNRPVIITGMMDDWPALRKWNLEFFASTLGDREVEVQLGRSAGNNYEVERDKYQTRLRFGDFVQRVRHAGVTNDFYVTASNTKTNKESLRELWDDIVQIPEYLDGSNPGAGFFWMGPAGTITPFHHDLTNNFMAQVIGRKRIKLAMSWDIPLMNNHFHVYSQIDGRSTPAHPDAGPGEAQIVEFVLAPGEILFLPIGCMHFVEGLDITVTVSFTNFVFDNDFHSFYTTYQGV